MQARKLSKSDIQLVSGLLNNDITRHCFNYENPWYLTDRYASNFSLLLELSEKKAMIESFEYARNFPIEEARKKFSENSGKQFMEQLVKIASGYILSERNIIQVRRPESSGNSGDFWTDEDYSHIPLFGKVDRKNRDEYYDAFYNDNNDDDRFDLFESVEGKLTSVEITELDYKIEEDVIGTTHSPTKGELAFLQSVITSGQGGLSIVSTPNMSNAYTALYKSLKEKQFYEREADKNYEENVDGMYWKRIIFIAQAEWGALHGFTRLWGEKEIYAFLSKEDRERHNEIFNTKDEKALKTFMKKLSGKIITPGNITKA